MSESMDVVDFGLNRAGIDGLSKEDCSSNQLWEMKARIELVGSFPSLGITQNRPDLCNPDPSILTSTMRLPGDSLKSTTVPNFWSAVKERG
jgi:hypothetical protein